jgi:peroxiredoxin
VVLISPNYVQHSARIEPGRDVRFNLIKAEPPSVKYEPGVILAEDDYVISWPVLVRDETTIDPVGRLNRGPE